MRHLLWVVGVAALVPAVIFFMKFSDRSDLGTGRPYLIASIAFLVVSLVFLGIFFFQKFREEGNQEISITKF